MIMMSRLFLLLICAFVFVTPQAGATALDDPAARMASSGGVAGGSGSLAPVENEVDAGEVTIGATAQVVMRFRNESSKEVKITAINLYPSSTVTSEVALDECSKSPLPSGAECAVVVAVKGLQIGNWRVEMLVRHDGRTRIVTSSMKGTVEQGEEGSDRLLGDIEAIPNEVDFGSIKSSTPIVRSVILRNITSDELTIKNVGVQAGAKAGYTMTSDCDKLTAGQACAATITWAPTQKGQAQGVLLVEHSGASKVASVDLKGEFDPEEVEKAKIFPEAVPGLGLLISSQEQMDFGSVAGEASITVSLVNVGDAEMQLGNIDLGGTDNGLTVGRSGCRPGMTLQPIEACPLTLTWTPVREGAIVDDVKIAHDGARGVLVIPVRGDSSRAVSKDSKAVVVDQSFNPAAKPIAEKSSALEGFVITSHSPRRAIINGPGGTRVINQGQQVVLGGVQWIVDITSTGVDFMSGKDRVRLLFDRSLSTINRSGAQSGSTGATGATGSSTPTGTTAPAAPTTTP
jgi:hypothetical protein